MNIGQTLISILNFSLISIIIVSFISVALTLVWVIMSRKRLLEKEKKNG